MSHPRRHTHAWVVLALFAELFLGAALVQPAHAADDAKADSSLKLVPADAAYYTAMLHNREQIDTIRKSNAWAKVTDLPAVQLLWSKVQAEYTKEAGGLAQLRAFYEQPENRELVALIGEAVSDEIFVYGGESWGDMLELFQRLNFAMQYGPLYMQARGGAKAVNPGKAQGWALMRALGDNLDLVKTPDMVVGFKIHDTKRAQAQLKRLEAHLTELAKQAPPLNGRFKRIEVDGNSFLTLNLDGEMVPWDQIPYKELEEKPGEFDAVIKKLKGVKLTVSLGVKDDYIVLGIGPSTDHVARLGKGPHLASRPELKPLTKFADKRFVSISYVSKAFKTKASTSPTDMESLAEVAKKLLGEAGLPEEQRKSIEKDVVELARDMKKYVPEVGASVSFAFLSERGFEGYSYDYGKHTDAAKGRPLTLLNHVGGNPILAVVGRSSFSADDYAFVVKWVKKIYGHADAIAQTKLEGDAKTKYEEVTKAFLPLVQRVDEVTGKMLLPSLADGQGGLVLDAKWTSKQWFNKMPPMPQPMPLLELAIVHSVNDAALLEKALGEYRTIANEAIAKIREIAPPGQVPDFKIPPAQTEKVTGGKLFFYPLPEEWGVDKQVTPTMGLSDKVMALALSHAHAQRLLANKPLQMKGGPLADTKRPLIGAVYFNFPVLVDALTPWVGLATASVDAMNLGLSPEDAKALGNIPQQVNTLLGVLKVLRGSTSAIYIEDGVRVTHSETVIEDLK